MNSNYFNNNMNLIFVFNAVTLNHIVVYKYNFLSLLAPFY